MISILSQLQAVTESNKLLSWDDEDTTVTIQKLTELLGFSQSSNTYNLLQSINIHDATPINGRITLTKELVKILLQKKNEKPVRQSKRTTLIKQVDNFGKRYKEMEEILSERIEGKFHKQHFQEAWRQLLEKHAQYCYFSSKEGSVTIKYVAVRPEFENEAIAFLEQEYIKRMKQAKAKIARSGTPVNK